MTFTPERRQTLTRLAAKRLKQISSGELSADVREKVSLCLLDFLGACQAGLGGELGEPLLKYAELHVGKPETFVFGSDKAMCAETAAFVHAALSNSLALAQRDGWTGEQLMRAIVGGYEMGAVLGHSIRGGGQFNTHFRSTALIGSFAAAGALSAGNTPDDEDTVMRILCFAINMACGINAWAHTGGREIYIHNGSASVAAITSYDLGRTGILVSDVVLEGKDGYFEALGVDPNASDRFKTWIESSPLGRGILETRFKPASCCNFTQASTAIALKMHKDFHPKITNVDNLAKMHVTTTPGALAYPGCDNAGPLVSKSSGKLSIQFGVCAALVFGRFDDDTSGRINDPVVTSLMRKMSVTTNSEFEKSYNNGLQPAKIEIFFKDGTVVAEAVPDVPWLDGLAVTERFLQEISRWLPAESAQKLVSRCQHLETVTDAGRELFVF
ncbi:hypothetical protein LTR10_021029 [Elasticomyces elasticus]|uniref:MmgE/PrpD family protein n=1 Tax=Exophiala sideris TaxID=1016849 RepID=A0ABR0J9B6_9EURO|nr:hypothetical protein LTR10_021029 [Elasticomyces elasticus]KAK5027749.1 hypothetical protein LTS07_006624 [Exophiala sideris]KAK5037661.1 hypothetical protein LTR13_004820 [Exophiala sideris]KAK5059323.1 hypothetical protein LTR69_006613 [Exophiala sideris]KAK5183157.1 hypothetical protein LTR44_004868 [Eurotiomycetes sp. CCFEE 6388]